MLDSLKRTLPYIWPYRRRLLLSVVFALAVGLLWGMNLSFVYPIMQVLFSEGNLEERYEAEIVELQNQKQEHQLKISYQNQILEETEGNRERVEIQRKVAVESAELSDIENKLWFNQWLLKYVIKHVSEDRFNAFAAIMGVLCVATVLKGICIFVQGYLVGGVVQLSIMGIRKRLFRKALAMDYQTLSGEGTSELTSRFTYDMDVLTNGLYLLGGKVIREPIKAIVCLGGALYVNWRLTILTFIIVPLAGVVFYRFGRTLKKASHRSIESMSRMYKVIGETFESIKVVLAFNGQRVQRRKFHYENKTFFEKSMKLVRVDALTSPTTEVLGLVAISLGLFPAVYLVLTGEESIWGIRLANEPMDVARLGVFYSFLIGMSDPARKMSSIYAKLKRASAAADRIFEFMDREPAVVEPRISKHLPPHRISIEFSNVNFAYQAKDRHAPPLALREVNLSVAAGETIAVVGANGSGKSTLVNLLPRFFDPDHGRVLIDGTDIRDVRLSDLRDQIGLVTQETILFDESIEANIRYGRPSATREQVEAAASKAHITEFLSQFPDGLQARVGEKGCWLSGGQRQRIALARAILCDPTIFILDEATSAIDSHSELLIHETLREFTQGRTTFIITHSLSQSMLSLVTRVAVMDAGQLVAFGTHADLLQHCELYREFHHLQSHQQATLDVVGDYEATDVISLESDSDTDERSDQSLRRHSDHPSTDRNAPRSEENPQLRESIRKRAH